MRLNIFAIIFLIIDAALLFWLPRRWASMPLLLGACYITLGQGILAGPFHFPIIRIILLIGFTRVILRGERLAGGLNGLDRLIIFFAALALVSSIFHKDPSSAFIFRLGFAYNFFGVYFLVRIFCQSIEDINALCITMAVLLIPVAVAMLYEKLFMFNLFSAIGGTDAIPGMREGKIRASGPFAHPILAGTVGAVCIPIMIGLWKQHRNIALLGVLSCLIMVIACASSGPIMIAICAIPALFMWRYKQHMRFVRWLAVIGYIALDIVMKAPAYYLPSRFDLVGGSSGWHRAALIESAINHIHEWWLWGTDYTRHWMASGVSWSPDHIDITNYYLYIGILGGLPLMLVFIAILVKGFSFVGQTVNKASDLPEDSRFLIWSIGASLFAHAFTSLSVSYFDQSFLFVYLTLAAIGSAYSCTTTVPIEAENPEQTPGMIHE